MNADCSCCSYGGPGAADVLAAAGRMALSHYLTRSLVLACVFTGYGFGLYDRVGMAVVFCGCVALYAARLASAHS